MVIQPKCIPGLRNAGGDWLRCAPVPELRLLSGFVVGRGIGQIPLIIGSMLSGFLALEGQNRMNYISTLCLVIPG